MRKVFYLPHQSSIKQWTSSINCEPGFLSEVFQDLQKQIEKNSDISDCALLIDGMAIRKQVLYDSLKSKYAGFVDYGGLVPESTETIASEALVFMLVGLKAHWKCPIGYFYTDKCGSEIQVSLINTCLSLAADHGLRIWTITCDGTYTNVNTLKILGCTFPDNFEEMKVKFKHPTKDYYVYGTLDACHMLKLSRNTFGDLKNIRSSNENTISWEFIENLHTLQEEEGLNLANKLHINHIFWRRHKMKVKLAAQTISSSVADALEFLQNDIKHEKFQNCSATVEFIRSVDRLFDILNSQHPFMRGFKSAIRISNLEIIKTVVVEISDYLLTLKDFNGQLLVYHRRKTFIIGLVSTAKSLIAISEELLSREVNPYKYILTYKFSQDHIELLFSCIRSRGGFNNNPNTLQFRTALKQILM